MLKPEAFISARRPPSLKGDAQAQNDNKTHDFSRRRRRRHGRVDWMPPMPSMPASPPPGSTTTPPAGTTASPGCTDAVHAGAAATWYHNDTAGTAVSPSCHRCRLRRHRRHLDLPTSRPTTALPPVEVQRRFCVRTDSVCTKTCSLGWPRGGGGKVCSTTLLSLAPRRSG
jgi:hypothetical protein